MTPPCRLANWSTPTPIQSGPAGRPPARCTHAAIRSHPRPSMAIPGHPGRLAASPSARALPPIPARLSPRRLASPHLTWPTGQFPSPARTQLRRGHRTPACLPGPRRERRPVSRPRPTGAPAPCGRPSCVQTFCGPKVIRGGRPPAHRVLATVSRGQLVNGPWTRTRARTASLP